jgi:hypothetical protein
MLTMKVSEHPEFDPNSPLEFPHWDQVVGDTVRELVLAAVQEADVACQLIGSPGWEGIWPVVTPQARNRSSPCWRSAWRYRPRMAASWARRIQPGLRSAWLGAIRDGRFASVQDLIPLLRRRKDR